jgi:flagellar hook-associated protein 3 FlgL
MRITSQTLHTRALTDLAQSQSRIAATQQQISSGRQITKPSDDALGTRDALRARAEVAQLNGFKAAGDAATAWTDATDTALQQVTDVVHRVRELLVKAASSSTSAADRKTIAQEVDQLTNSVKDSINQRQGDQYLFGGTDTTAPPYPAGSDTYDGDAGVVARTIGPGVAVQVNVLGSAVLGSGKAAGDGLLLNTLRDISDHLNADDVSSLGTTDLRALGRNLDTLTAVRATTGATQSRIEAAGERVAEAEGLASDRLGEIEGVDYAKAILDLNAQSTAYQAALKSAAQIIQPSLLDFLR